ncbi:MAG TPA: ATP-binding protein [Actinomycetota bacterium]|nr:ATP-binding protein [Actinomycetota bacterium]
MTPELPAPLIFAGHLLGLLVSLGAALALGRERGQRTPAKVGAVLGFLALAIAEGYHGSGLADETSAEASWLRAAGYTLLLIAAITPAPRAALAAAFGPGTLTASASATAAAALAGIASMLRRRHEPGGFWLGAGILVLGGADGLLALEGLAWAEEASHLIRVVGYVFIARTVVGLSRHSMQFRFVVGFGGLLVAVVLFVSAAIGTVIDRNLRDTALERVLAQSEQAQANLRALAVSPLRVLVSLGQSAAIAQPIQSGRSVPVSTITFLRDNLLPDVDFVLFLDRGGEVRGRLGLGRSQAVEVVGTEVVDFALRTGKEVGSLDALSRGNLALLGVSAIRPPGQPKAIGFAVAGFAVDADLLQRTAIGGLGNRAVAFRGRRGAPPALAAAAGFPEGTAVDVPDQVLTEAFGSFLAGGEEETRTLRMAGREHFVAMAPLRKTNGEPVGILMVAEPAAVLGATRQEVNQVLFLVTVAVFGLAFLLALVAARRITRPLVALTGAARRVQAGELEAKADVGGEDEVADLAGAFNQMTDSVNAMTAELRLAATEQSQLRARLETVVNSMGDGLIAVDDDNRVVTYNPAAGEIVGMPRSGVVGKPLREVLRGRDSSGRSLAARKWAPSGLAFVRRADGDEVPVAISSAPLQEGDGASLGRVYVLRDMSREHEVERMKTEFLSNISHELRAPLTPIIGYSQIMTRRPVPADQGQQFARSILESGQRLERIVAMLVDFSAIEAGRLPMATEPTSLRTVVQDTVERWRERAGEHKIETRFARRLPPADVNASLFARMLDELLDNAVKYSPNGGKITVAVNPEGLASRRMLKVEVTDKGIGIESEDLARIFQDFRQVDASDTRPFGGLGLGLTFVKRLAEAHGGSMDAESKLGKGSTFSFTVPAAGATKKRKVTEKR